MSPPLRRFIAGATCPVCKGMDKIYVTLEDEREVARCTVCDYRSVRPMDDDPVVHPDDEPVSSVIRFTPRSE
jgi:uncharacterized metal-binding protein (TIGR02443 family)